VCLICAEPLDLVSVLPCGHSDVCALCTTRLRVIMEDKKCCACQKESDKVLITRNQGNFTSKFPFDVEMRIKQKTLFPLEACCQICYDDEDCRDDMDVKCALTCSVCYGKGVKLQFKTMKALKAHLKGSHGLFMCDVCLGGRQVFVNEQVLYTRSELTRHYKRGDAAGVMADAGFKGHPTCQFCKKHFYSDQELYSHMQTQHMQCFLCKKARPNDYVYYKNLKELTDHFVSNHHFCTHEDCKDKHPEERVFNTKEEFHVHYVQNHGESLSKAQKKQALQINFDYPSRREEAPQRRGRDSSSSSSRNNSSRAGREEPSYHQPSYPSLSQASRAQQRQEDFPRMQESAADVFAGMDSHETHWRRAAGGSHGSVGSGGGIHRGEHQLTQEDYPALPGMSKSAKKRAKAKAKAHAAVTRNQSQSSSWGQSTSSAPSAGPSAPSSSPSPAAAAPSARVRALQSNPSQDEKDRNRLLMQTLRRELDSIVFNAFRQESANFLNGDMTPARYYKHIKALGLVHHARELAQLCPDGEKRKELVTLIEGDAAVSEPPKPRIDQREENEKFVNLASLLRKSKPSSSTPAAAGAPAANEGNFPSLGGGPSPASANSFSALGEENRAAPPTTGRARPAPERKAKSAPQKEEIRENKVLMDQLRKQLSPKEFTGFRTESMNFLRGVSTAEEYYNMIVSTGLTDFVDSLAGLCPDRLKRDALLSQHKTALLAAMQYGAPAAAASNSFADEGVQPKAKGKKKKKKKFEKVRLGDVNWDELGGGGSSGGGSSSRRVNPNNDWSIGAGNSLF